MEKYEKPTKILLFIWIKGNFELQHFELLSGYHIERNKIT